MNQLPDLIRRRLLLGAGSAAVLGGAALVAAPAAAAAAGPTVDPSQPETPTAIDHLGPPAQTLASPITSTIASARRSGYSYRTAGEWDFTAEGADSFRKFGTKGVYSSAVPSLMWASFDIPAGALVRDVEFYVFNNTGVSQYASMWLWSASDGYLGGQLASATIPSMNQLIAVSTDVTPANYGPYPPGTKVFVTLYTTSDAKLQINGARIGMTGGGSQLGFLDTPSRIYDSRASSKFAANEVRTITVPAAVAPRGCTGIAANLTVTEAATNGIVKIWPGHGAEPASSALNFRQGVDIANALPVGISSSGQVKIRVSTPVHVIIDVSGVYG